MFTKVYEKTKEILSKNYKELVFMFIFVTLFTIPLPYYINAPGGLMDVSDRVVIENSFNAEGSLNMAYVSEIKATIPTLIMSVFNKDWDVLKEEELTYENETADDMYYRDHLMLEESVNNAIIVGFTKAGKNVEIASSSLMVTYIDEDSITDLKIGDEILSIDEIEINNTNDISEIFKNKNEGDTISIKVISDKKEMIKTANLKKENNRLVIGILITNKKEVETIPKVELKFKKSESGPSGGLMTALSIYNYLTEEDITKGRTIVGTGTIDQNGNVGAIGGVKYKLKGAVKNKAQIFLVPNGENYEEAIKIKKENDYNIEIVGVSTFDDALNYLMDL